MRIGEVLARSIKDFNEKTMQFSVHNTLTTDENNNLILGEHTKTFNKRTHTDGGQRFLPLGTPILSELTQIIDEQKISKN